jgi:hypothetical protein
LDVVKGWIGFPIGINAPVVVGSMRRCIPAPFAQIKPAGEGDGIVDHHHFLMLGCTDRVVAVQAKMDAFVGSPLELVPRKKFAFQRIDHGKIPAEQVNMKPLFLGSQDDRAVYRDLTGNRCRSHLESAARSL